MRRSKRRNGTLTRPWFIGLPVGSRSAPQIQLIQSLIFLLLVLNIISDHFFVATYFKCPKGKQLIALEADDDAIWGPPKSANA